MQTRPRAVLLHWRPLVARNRGAVIFFPQASFGLEFVIKISAVVRWPREEQWALNFDEEAAGIALAQQSRIPYNPKVLNQQTFLCAGMCNQTA